jgi:hypothetical protein
MPSNLADIPDDKRIYALHVGDSGSGKSCAAAMYAPEGKTYIFDLDGRVQGIKGHPPIRERIKKGLIEFDQYPATKDGFEKMGEKLTGLGEEYRKGRMPYSTIVYDTLTKLETMSENYILHFTDKSADTVGKVKLIAGPAAWRSQGRIFEELLTVDLKALKCNVVVGAHWTTKYRTAEGQNEIDPKTGKPALMIKNIPDGMMIALREKLSIDVPTDFNEVFFFEKQEMSPAINPTTGLKEPVVRHVCIFRNGLARTTFTALPNLVDWTNKDFWQILMDAKEKEKTDALVPVKQ